MRSRTYKPFYVRIRSILESARSSAARSVNTAQVAANWLIGREIVEEEQRGKGRAGYGERLLTGLAQRLKRDYGNGFSVSALQYMRSFYTTYPSILTNQHALRVDLPPLQSKTTAIQHALRVELSGVSRAGSMGLKSWKPGILHPNLS